MKKKPFTLDILIKEFFPFFKQHGMEEQNIRNYFETWKLSHPVSTVNDFAWMIFNSILNEIPKQVHPDHPNFYRFQNDTYFHMAIFQRKYEGKNSNHTWQLMLKTELNKFHAELSFQYKVEIIGHKTCTHSMEYAGHLFDPSFIMKNFPVANERCTREEGCICSVGAEAVRDNKGRLIPR